MNHKVKWGILSTAHIAINDVIPAMIKSKYCDIRAVASRNAEKDKIESSYLKYTQGKY